jgi:hypothetical protein
VRASRCKTGPAPGVTAARGQHQNEQLTSNILAHGRTGKCPKAQPVISLQRVDVEIAEEFLERLDAPLRSSARGSECRSIFLLRRDRSPLVYHYPVGEPQARHELLQGVNDIGGDATGVFFGLGLLESRPATGRGRDDDVVAVSSFVVDVDAKSFPSPSACERFIRERLRELGLEPTILVQSGHGFHVYLFLTGPWRFSEDGDRAAYRQRQRWLAENLRGDHIIDPARIMRLPGTLNRKDASNPVACEIIEVHLDSRVAVEDIAALPATSDAVLDGEFELGEDLNQDEHDRVYSLLRRYARVSRRVRNTVLCTELSCASESEQDFVLMCILFKLGFTIRQTVHVARHQRLKRNGERTDKVGRIDYWERTAASALDRVG